jgi:predicted transcriptional regulator
MRKQTPYISSSVAIKGINVSGLAKSETNDCVVRAFASAFNVTYDFAHKKVAEIFGRKNREGTRFFSLMMRALESKGISINRKKVQTITKDVNLSYWIKVKGVNTLRSMTTAKFLEDYPKGTYIVTVKGHAFTIKDGVVIGNPEDATKRKKTINGAWKIG